MIENGDGKFWLTVGDVGIKVFPRVASTTLREQYGHGNSRAEFMRCRRKAVIVRSPDERLFSTWAGLIRGSSTKFPDYPEDCKYPAAFWEFVISQNKELMDWHIRPMKNQMGGWQPKYGEVWKLSTWMDNTPYGLQTPTKRHHHTPDRHRELCATEWTCAIQDNPDLHNKVLDFYTDDYWLFKGAQ